MPNVNRSFVRESMASGSILQRLAGRAGDYYLAGTEIGLGIPGASLFMSCSYDEAEDRIILQWVNPPGGYDWIVMHLSWSKDEHRSGDAIPGSSTSFRIDRKRNPQWPLDINDLDVWLVGLRGKLKSREALPSNATGIHLSSNGRCQEETYGIPFTCGIAPNWAAWSTTEKPDTAAFEQGEKYTNLRQSYNPARALSTKPFYQVVKAPPSGVAHGVYRKFLGLTPGHTYRLTACLTTLEMDSVQGDWSFSLHATHNGAERKDLAIQQLAGLAVLPDGKRGPQAGRIAYYHRGKTTKANHEIVFSGDKAASENEDASHITLPADADTITVWVRFSCSDPKGSIGFSGVKLEDISDNPNPKSPEQIISEERDEEINLLKREEKALLRETGHPKPIDK